MQVYQKSILRFSSYNVTKLQPTQECMAMTISSLLNRSRWKIDTSNHAMLIEVGVFCGHLQE